MKKQYKTMQLQIMQFVANDIVTLSIGTDGNGDDYFMDIYGDGE